MSAATAPAPHVGNYHGPLFGATLVVGEGAVKVAEDVSLEHVGGILIPDIAAKAVAGDFDASEVVIEIMELAGRTMTSTQREYLHYALRATPADADLSWRLYDSGRVPSDVAVIVMAVDDPEAAKPS